jgi:hypothetical protein
LRREGKEIKKGPKEWGGMVLGAWGVWKEKVWGLQADSEKRHAMFGGLSILFNARPVGLG